MLFNRLRRLFSPPGVHPVLKAYRAMTRDVDQDRSLEDIDFVAVDTELTGLDPKKGEIVSIGAVRIRKLSIIPSDSFMTLIRPERGIPKASALIHRITPEVIADAPALADVLPRFFDYCGSSLMVGHCIGLDVSFLNTAATRLYGGVLETPCIDTIKLAQIYEDKRWDRMVAGQGGDVGVSYNLGELTERYGLPGFPQHDSYFDAVQAAYLFVYLARKLAAGRVMTLSGLWRSSRLWWLR